MGNFGFPVRVSRRLHYRECNKCLFFLIDSAVRIIKYYLYHKIQLPKEKVVNGAAFVITPFPSKLRESDSFVNGRVVGPSEVKFIKNSNFSRRRSVLIERGNCS